MTHSPLAGDIRISSQSSSRQDARIDRFIVHHAASLNHYAVVDMMVKKTRVVSSNYVVGDTITGVVDEDLRAWTSGSPTDGGKGSAFDRRAITAETINNAGEPHWTVSDKTFDNLARLIADVATRHGFDINDDTVLTHQDLWSRFRASYATACPGDLQRRKAELITLARSYAAPVNHSLLRRQKEDTMYFRGASNPDIYEKWTDANGTPRVRLAGKAEAAYAAAGGLVIFGDDATLTQLGIEGQYRKPFTPTVSADIVFTPEQLAKIASHIAPGMTPDQVKAAVKAGMEAVVGSIKVPTATENAKATADEQDRRDRERPRL